MTLLRKAGTENFVYTANIAADDIIFAKGVYPYSYMYSCDRFAETSLPEIEKFHDNLKDEPFVIFRRLSVRSTDVVSFLPANYERLSRSLSDETFYV